MKMQIDKDWLKPVEIIRIDSDDYRTYYCKGHVIDAVFMRDLAKELKDPDHYLLKQEPERAYFKAAYNFQEETTWYYECDPAVRGCFPVTYVMH